MASLFGCGDRQPSAHDAKAEPLTPEQSGCIKRAGTKLVVLQGEVAKRQLEAMKEQRSTIDLTLQERRMTEEICLEEAKCFGGGELVLGTIFDDCLHQAERAGEGG